MKRDNKKMNGYEKSERRYLKELRRRGDDKGVTNEMNAIKQSRKK